jgi:Zn-dependent peptidase ImmA (M78 family)
MHSYPLNTEIQNFIRENVPNSFYKEGRLKLHELFKSLGIEACFAIFGDQSVRGLIQREVSGWKVYVQGDESPKNQRFMLAHALGHFVSYKCNGASKKAFEENDYLLQDDFCFHKGTDPWHPEEKEASAIAAALLMPEPDVHRLVENQKTLEHMSDYFKVPESIMASRLLHLGYRSLTLPIHCD